MPNTSVKSEAEVRVAEPLIDSYIAASGNAALLKKAVRTAWADAQKGDSSFFLVILAMQNQQLIEQNERILGALEKKSRANRC
ncbi:MAG: hypothetical protein EOO38_09610 [Cytophagaceae bacterium]|nr:MAG: hypothetical protein EOO38_09610 [Cytophagaceae bacterium]